jgi:hypothetical protein
MQSQSQLFESLFKHNGSDRSFLEDIAAKHPYFAPAQFYLLEQTGTSSEEYNKQAAKTSLLFNNSYWLNHQLQPAKESSIDKKEVVTETVPLQEAETKRETVQEEKAPEVVMNKPVLQPFTPTKEPMLFEPMHMVDYFASQGIKLSEEIQTGDKLGKQLKSFTEWLKTMKKVHTDKLPGTSQQSEIAVQTLAEKSNAEDDVITEAMAEVFAMQGKTSKAIEVYQKLSLLNPAKSAFFAAKIEQLKG